MGEVARGMDNQTPVMGRRLRDPVLVPAGAPQTVTVNAGGLQPSTTFHVTVTATNADGSAPLPEDPCCLIRDVSTPVFGGMLFASLIGIFVIPPLYVLFQSARERFRPASRPAAAKPGVPVKEHR